MKVKTNFKQMVLVDHLLYNKLDSISKPDVHVQHVRTPIINSFPPNPILPPTSPPSNVAPPPPANYSAPPIASISEPPPNNDNSAPNNEWETQAHQWIDTFQQPNYANYNDKSVQMEDNSNTAQSEPVEYTNTPQRAVIPKTIYTQPSATALPQKNVEQQMEIEYNQTPSIANAIKKAVEQEKRLHIEYAPPLPSIYVKPQNHNNVQQRDHFNIMHQPPQKEQQMELDYYTPRPITHTTTTTPMTISTLDPTPLALPSLPAPPTLPTPTAPLSLAAPATFRSLPAPPTVRSLPAPRAPLSLTHAPTSVRDFSKNEECDECANTVEYEKKLPITYETNASKAMVPYNDYISIGASPGEKKVFYTCTRCNTNFTKQSSLINHNKRFHAAFEQTEKGLKRKPKGEVMPYGIPLMKQQKMRGVKRRYKQNSGSNKEIVPYKPYVLEKTT